MEQTVIVTGASGNLGRAVVRKFIETGSRVIGTLIPNDPVVLDFPPESFSSVVVNLADEHTSQQFVEGVTAMYGSIDAAVLTVGGFAMGDVAHTRTEDIGRQYRLNFETTYNIARPVFMQLMRQGSGRIFITGARPGLDAKAGKGMVAYSLAKSLLFRLAELLNEEAAGSNVVTSVVVPGTIDTPQNRQAMPGADTSTWVKPEAIADIIHFYTSPAAAALREPVIKVYGGA